MSQAPVMQSKADQAVAAWEALKAAPLTPEDAIAEAEEQAKVLMWAAKNAAEKGAPQAATYMQAKADNAVAALQALQANAGVSMTSPVASAPVASTTSGTVSKEELAAAEKQAKLLLWAAKTTAAQGA